MDQETYKAIELKLFCEEKIRQEQDKNKSYNILNILGIESQ
jgi:hypothetical protein